MTIYNKPKKAAIARRRVSQCVHKKGQQNGQQNGGNRRNQGLLPTKIFVARAGGGGNKEKSLPVLLPVLLPRKVLNINK